jgi:hypothetical protein
MTSTNSWSIVPGPLPDRLALQANQAFASECFS